MTVQASDSRLAGGGGAADAATMVTVPRPVCQGRNHDDQGERYSVFCCNWRCCEPTDDRRRRVAVGVGVQSPGITRSPYRRQINDFPTRMYIYILQLVVSPPPCLNLLLASWRSNLRAPARTPWQLPPERKRPPGYERLEKLGAGINGEVFKVWDTQDNLIVAVKRLSGSGDDGFIISGLPEVMREAMCLGACRGIPSIVQHRRTYADACQSETGDSFIVMDYVGRLNLRGYMQRRVRRRRPFSEDEVRRIMKQLVEGVKAVHGVGVLHLDIKPENKPKEPVEADVRSEIKDDRIVYKIGGFGMSTKGRGKEQPEVIILTPYSAPELLLHSREYNDRVDTWGLGCIMADLLSGTGASIFDGESDIEIMAKVFGIVGTEGIKEWSGYSGLAADQKSKLPGKVGVSRLRHKFPSRKLSSAGFEVLSGLLESNPEKRLSAAEALKKPWFHNRPRGFAGFFKSCVGGVLPEN
uniref:[RNA-polymerase]-subunit kinase n=1 Tax=Aegilops tauschii TaxID=37682 RepID=M8C534_AEGTA